MNLSRRLYRVTFLCDFSLMLLIFAVSRDLAERHAGLWTMGWVGGGTSVVYAFSSVLGGRLSDHWTRRTIVLVGAGANIVSAFGLIYFRNYFPAFVAAYWVSGLAGGLIYPAIIAWLSSTDGSGARPTRDATRILFFFCLAWNFGMLFGQLAGGLSFRIDPVAPVVIAAVASLISMLLILATPASALPARATVAGFDSEEENKQLLSSAFVRVAWAANVASAYCMGLVMHLFPDLAVALGVHADRHGAFLSLMRLLVVAIYLLMHRLAFWHHRFSVNLIAQLSAIGGLCLLSRAVSGWGLLAGLCGLSILMGYTYFSSLYYSTSGAHDRKKGRASGLHEATFGLGLASGAVFGGYLGAEWGPRVPYLTGIAVVGFSMLIQCLIYRRYVVPVSRLVKSCEMVQK